MEGVGKRDFYDTGIEVEGQFMVVAGFKEVCQS